MPLCRCFLFATPTKSSLLFEPECHVAVIKQNVQVGLGFRWMPSLQGKTFSCDAEKEHVREQINHSFNVIAFADEYLTNYKNKRRKILFLSVDIAAVRLATPCTVCFTRHLSQNILKQHVSVMAGRGILGIRKLMACMAKQRTLNDAPSNCDKKTNNTNPQTSELLSRSTKDIIKCSELGYRHLFKSHKYTMLKQKRRYR